mgnify:CR=1 FL=1
MENDVVGDEIHDSLVSETNKKIEEGDGSLIDQDRKADVTSEVLTCSGFGSTINCYNGINYNIIYYN